MFGGVNRPVRLVCPGGPSVPEVPCYVLPSGGLFLKHGVFGLEVRRVWGRTTACFVFGGGEVVWGARGAAGCGVAEWCLRWGAVCGLIDAVLREEVRDA